MRPYVLPQASTSKSRHIVDNVSAFLGQENNKHYFFLHALIEKKRKDYANKVTPVCVN